METLRHSVFMLCAAALFCSMICELLKSTSVYPLARWVSALVLLLALLKPLTSLPGINIPQWFFVDQELADSLISQGEQQASQAKAAFITRKTSSYIEDIAESMGIDARVDVVVTEETFPVPIGVRIYAQASPYLKLQLEGWIQENLNIPKENLIWIG